MDLSDLNTLKQAQAQCRVTTELQTFIDEGVLPKEQNLRRIALTEGKNLFVRNGILHRLYQPTGPGKIDPITQVVVPTSLRHVVLRAAHDALIGGGHFGTARTYARIREKWWWPGMYDDVANWVASCHTCAQTHHSAHGVKGPLQPIQVSEPFELVGMDLVGKLGTTTRGNSYILVITDHFSKWAITVPMAQITSQEVADAFIENLVLQHGIPIRLLTDRGSNFISELSNILYNVLNMAKSTTTAYHPQGDGHTERFNDTLVKTLSKLMAEHPLDWEELLPYCTFSYNTSVHASTKLTPFYILYGREARTPMDLLFGRADPPVKENLPTYIRHLAERLEEAATIARTNLRAAQTIQKAYYDSNQPHSLQPYKEGDLVWVRNHKKPRTGESSKFLPKWIGPYTVLRRTGPVNYLVKGGNFPEQVIHVLRMRRYTERRPSLEVSTNDPTTVLEGATDIGMDVPSVPTAVEEDQKPLLTPLEDTSLIPDLSVPVVTAESKGDTEADTDKIIDILERSLSNRRIRYLVSWSSGTTSWVEEADMDCPELLVKFTEKNKPTRVAESPEYPHIFIPQLLRDLETYLKLLQQKRIPSMVTVKRRLKELVGPGSAHLRSLRTAYAMEAQVSQVVTHDQAIALIQSWLQDPNHTFIHEWDTGK